MNKLFGVVALLAVACVLIASPAGAADYYYWSLALGEGWVSTSSNWGGSLVVPGDTNNDDYAYVQTAGTLKIDDEHVFAGALRQFRVGTDVGTGTVVQSGGTVNLYENVVVGFDGITTGTSTYTMTGGSIIQDTSYSNPTVAIGGKGSNGAMYVSGGTSDLDTTSIVFNGTNGLRIGYGSTGGSGLVSLDEYAYMKIGKYIRLGKGTDVTGELTMAGDSYAEIVNVSGNISYIGSEKGSTGTLNMSGNAEVLFNTGDNLYVGHGTGTSESERATGAIDLSGDAIFVANQVDLCRGNYATGTLDISGSASYTSTNTYVGVEGAANIAAMNVSGGTADINGQLCIGRSLSTGTVTLSNGSIDVSNYVRLGDNGGTATFNLDGGTLSCDKILSEAGDDTYGTTTGTFNFNGGVLQANGENPTLISLDDTYTTQMINVKAGGAIIDSNGYDIGINQALLDGVALGTDGGLTKIGAGTLTLGAANTYTGATTVIEGGLAVNGSITSNVAVAATAALSGAGTITGNVDLNGTFAVAYDSNADTIDLLTITGELDLTGATISLSDVGSGTLTDGAYVFATYDTLLGNPATESGLLSGWSIDYAYGGNSIALLVSGSPLNGDANHDGKVDAADVSIMAANWGAVSATWEMGDFSENGTVGPEDAKLLAQNWGTGGGSEAAAVPEPSTLIMLLSFLGLTVLRRRRG